MEQRPSRICVRRPKGMGVKVELTVAEEYGGETLEFDRVLPITAANGDLVIFNLDPWKIITTWQRGNWTHLEMWPDE